MNGCFIVQAGVWNVHSNHYLAAALTVPRAATARSTSMGFVFAASCLRGRRVRGLARLRVCPWEVARCIYSRTVAESTAVPYPETRTL